MKIILKKIIVSILTLEARVVLWKYRPKIVAVTGSVGKTSTKDAVYAVISTFYSARRSEKSFNSEIGIPLTILGVQNAWSNPWRWFLNILEGIFLIFLPNHYPQWLVLEVGADRPGDIKRISKWLKPNGVVITMIPDIPVHVEYFKNVEEVVEEKSNIVRAIKKDGILVVNSDDPRTRGWNTLTKSKAITYGFGEDATLKASNYDFLYEKIGVIENPIGIAFKANYNGNSFPVTIKSSVGVQHVYPILSALALAVGFNLNLVDSTSALEKHMPPPGRMKLVCGASESTIIDDTYNSSPVALSQALQTLKNLRCGGRKFAVLGDMLELGKYSLEEHEKAGKEVANCANILLTVGPRAQTIAEAAHEAGMRKRDIFQFTDARAAGEYLAEKIGSGDIILVKGSQSMRMERTVEALMAHPEDKKKLLVRQDEEWKKR